jgi:NAD+ kinase
VKAASAQGGAPRVAVVLKRSSWRKWVEEERDVRIATLLEKKDDAVRRMRPGHIDHVETIEEVTRALAELGTKAHFYDRPHDFRVKGRFDLVVTVGGDGTLLAASHGIGPGVPLLGVNSSPDNSVGFFCAAKKGGVKDVLASALRGSLPGLELARMRIDLNGERLLDRVLNEALFCHLSPAATSRYTLRLLDARGRTQAEEEQKSSGMWIGPSAGSTAAQRSAGGHVLPPASRKLQYVVREPYRPRGGSLKMTLGLVESEQALAVKSKMRQARLFIDGEHIAYDVTIGDVVMFQRSNEPLIVLGLEKGGPSSRRRTAAKSGKRRVSKA